MQHVDQELHASVTSPLVDIQPIAQLYPLDRAIRPYGQIDIEGDGIQLGATSLRLNLHLQMLTTHQTLGEQAEFAIKCRLGKCLPPRPSLTQLLGQRQAKLIDRQLAIG